MTRNRKSSPPARPRPKAIAPKHTDESYSAQQQRIQDLAAENNWSEVFVSNAGNVSIGRGGASKSQQIKIEPSTSEHPTRSHPPRGHTPVISQTAHTPLQPYQANFGTSVYHPMGPPPLYAAAPLVPIPSRRPLNMMFDHVYEGHVPVSQPTPAPAQLIAPVVDVPAVGQMSNASEDSIFPQTERRSVMYQPAHGPVALRPQYVYHQMPNQQAYGAMPPPQSMQMMDHSPFYFPTPPGPKPFVGFQNEMLYGAQVSDVPQVFEPTLAPVQPAAPTVGTAAVEQLANANRQTFMPSRSVEERMHQMKAEIKRRPYSPLKRRWDDEEAVARGRAQVEANSQTRQERRGQETVEGPQQPAAAVTEPERPTKYRRMEVPDQWTSSLPLRPTVPNAVSQGEGTSMPPDAGYIIARAPPVVHEGYEPMIRDVEPIVNQRAAGQLSALKYGAAGQGAGQESPPASDQSFPYSDESFEDRLRSRLLEELGQQLTTLPEEPAMPAARGVCTHGSKHWTRAASC